MRGQGSELGRENEALAQDLIATCKAEKKPLSFAMEHARSSWMQFQLLFWKYWLAYWRSVPAVRSSLIIVKSQSHTCWPFQSHT